MFKKIAPYLFIASVFFPMLFLLMLSLGRKWHYPSVFPEKITLENWYSLFETGSDLLKTGSTSIIISLTVAFLVTTIAFPVSRSIARSRYRSLFMMLTYIPYLLSPVIMAVIFQVYFIISRLTGTVTGVVIAQFLIAFPFAIIIFNNFWNHSIQAMETLSESLGAKKWQTFVKITIPLSKNALALCFFQVFLISWFEYGLTNLIGSGKIKTLTVSVFNFVNEANIFYAAVACCLLILPPLLLLYLNKRFIFFSEKASL